MSSGQERLATFRALADERLMRMNLAWISFEQAEDDEAGKELMRELHTLKGESALMGMQVISALAHALEDAVQPWVTAGVAPDAEAGDRVLRGLDLIGELLQPHADPTEAHEFLEELGATPPPQTEAPAQPSGPPQPARASAVGAPPASASPQASDNGAAVGKDSGIRRAPAVQIRVSSEKLDGLRRMVGGLLLARFRLLRSVAELRSAREQATGIERLLSSDHPSLRRAAGNLIQTLAGIEGRLKGDDHELDRLVGELEAMSRDLRMVPIRTLLEQYPRAVRTLARKLNKEARLEFYGDTVEVDRAVLEVIEEPLLHLVRNAVDHGLERPEQRRRHGKPAEGVIRIGALVTGQSLVVTVADDGRGIDVDKVRHRAVDLGLLSGGEDEHVSERDILQFLFSSGLSTRQQVTDVSGRGIGLDVVLSNVEGLGGSVTVESQPGVGTTFTLTVPLSIALTSVVLFRLGNGRYALPAGAVRALVDAAEFPPIDRLDGPAIRLDGELVPVLDLRDALQDRIRGAPEDRHPRLVVAESAGLAVALAGTAEHMEREAVLQPTGRFFDDHPLVRAVVPLEDGQLALVLHAGELVALSRGKQVTFGPAPDGAERHGKTVLVVDDSPVIRDLLAEALRSHGLRVIEASDGQEALATLSANADIDLVVTDIEMPRLDGIGLIEAVRATEGGADRLPMVVVSMRGSDDDKQRAVAAGADAYLVKTDFSHKGLWAMIHRFLE